MVKNKAQGAFEYLLLIGGVLFLAVAVIMILRGHLLITGQSTVEEGMKLYRGALWSYEIDAGGPFCADKTPSGKCNELFQYCRRGTLIADCSKYCGGCPDSTRCVYGICTQPSSPPSNLFHPQCTYFEPIWNGSKCICNSTSCGSGGCGSNGECNNKCVDGTPVGLCTINQIPFYCAQKNMLTIANCSECGCLDGLTCSDNGKCVSLILPTPTPSPSPIPTLTPEPTEMPTATLIPTPTSTPTPIPTPIPPTISNVLIQDITNQSATITWENDKPANAIINYGKTTALGTEIPIIESKSTHTFSMIDLINNTKYYFNITSCVQSSCKTYGPLSFTTLQNFILTTYKSTYTHNTSKITWTTNKLANSSVNYGKTTALGKKVTSTSLVTSHSIDLSPLEPNTLYYYNITTCNQTECITISNNFSTYLKPPCFVKSWKGYNQANFGSTVAIAIDKTRNWLYVLDNAKSNVVKFDLNGKYLTKWGSEGSGNGQFNYSWGIAVDNSGNVYVADSRNYRIQKFNSNGQFLTKWGSEGSGDGQFKLPIGIAISSTNVYVTDLLDHSINMFDLNGNFIKKWKSFDEINSYSYNPSGVVTDSLNNVYVSTYDDSTIKWNNVRKYKNDGGYILQWGKYGSDIGQFINAYGIGIDKDNNIYLADSGNNRIQVFNSTGGFLTTWGSEGSGDGQFKKPMGVVVDNSNNIYVVDFENTRIQKFSYAECT